jgi:hypothetical protein
MPKYNQIKIKIEVSKFVVIAFLFTLPDIVTGTNTISDYGIPKLGNTTFLSNTLIKNPFINTRIRNTLGFGQTLNLQTPLNKILGETVPGLTGELYYARLNFEYQYAVRDWMAVWGEIQINGRLGSDMQTLLTQGVNALTGFQLGWLFRLWQTERHILSLSADVNKSSAAIIDIYNFLKEAIEEGGIDEQNKIISDTPIITTALGLRYAYAISDMFGLAAIGRVSYGESLRREESAKFYHSLGFTLHIDLKNTEDIPLGFVTGYRHSAAPEGGDDSFSDAQAVLFNISYTGRDDLNIGLDIQYQQLPMMGYDDRVEFLTGQISITYYF